jgi:signal transduction histidine kinase
VEVHAQILDAILTGRTLRTFPLWSSALLLMLLCAGTIVGVRRWHGLHSAAFILAMAVAVYATCFAVFVFAQWILPVAAMLLAVILAPAVAYVFDFIQVERSLTRRLRELERWLASRGTFTYSHDGGDLSWKLGLLHELQSELGAMYELHTTLLETSKSLIAIFDQHGRLLLHNRSFARLLSTSLTFEQLRSFLADGNVQLVPAEWGEEGELILDGEPFALTIAALPPTTVSPKGANVVTLTSLKLREERDRARAEALGFVSHELRTPLIAIQGFAEIMMEYPGSAAHAQAPQTIFRESRRLLALISTYLDVLRIDAGARPVRFEQVQLDQIVSDVFELLQPLAVAADVSLQFAGQHALSLLGDSSLISGAVLNLVSNAMKYGKTGTDVLVRCENKGETVDISVHNQSEPIPPAELERVFEPYYRARKSETEKSGWGLGLAFVKRIAEKHGGSVHAQSSSSGTSFEIRLPARQGTMVVKRAA